MRYPIHLGGTRYLSVDSLSLQNYPINIIIHTHVEDAVYTEGGTEPNQRNVQTTLVPAGGSAIVDYKLDVPGTYILVDHSIFRTFNKGSLGMMKVEGDENKAVYSGKEVDSSYLSELGDLEKKPEPKESQPKSEDSKPLTTKAELMSVGKNVYSASCLMCHQQGGEGLPGVFPPLAKSDYMSKLAGMSDRSQLVAIPLKGLVGKITVNGSEYNSVMPPVSGSSDQDLAAVLTFVTNSWGNTARPFSTDEVRAARSNIGEIAPAVPTEE